MQHGYSQAGRDKQPGSKHAGAAQAFHSLMLVRPQRSRRRGVTSREPGMLQDIRFCLEYCFHGDPTFYYEGMI